MDNSNRNSSLIPDMPRDLEIVDGNNRLNPAWSLGFESLFQALQNNFKNEGFLIPSLSEENINFIQSIYTPYIGNMLPMEILDISGQLVFDKTNRVSKQFVITYSALDGTVTSAQWRTLQYV